MAARVSSRRRWFMRDVPRTYLLLVWLGFSFTLLIYFNDWRPSGWSALRHDSAAVKPQRNEAEVYTGSVIIVPTRGENCWQLMLDNRTGKMWEKGYVNCYEAVSRPDRERSGLSTVRMNAIGKAFNGGAN